MYIFIFKKLSLKTFYIIMRYNTEMKINSVKTEEGISRLKVKFIFTSIIVYKLYFFPRYIDFLTLTISTQP